MLTEEVWTGIQGKKLEDLHQSSKYLLPSQYCRLIPQSEGTRWLGSYTGTRIRGYVTAPETGDYLFWLSESDDKSNDEIYLENAISLV